MEHGSNPGPEGGAQQWGRYPQSGQTPYEPFPQGGSQPYAALPYGYNPYGQPPVFAGMPGSVRSARIIAFVFGGLGVALIVAGAVFGGAEFAGALFATFLLPLIIAGCAFTFGTAGNRVRITVIVLAALQTLAGVGSMAQGAGGGVLNIAASVAILILMSKAESAAWFKRPR